jgi:hypothetical protein
LTREEFDALVALKSPLVQIRGQWVQLDPEQIEAAIHFWEQQGMEGTLSLPEAMRLGLTSEEQRAQRPAGGRRGIGRLAARLAESFAGR